MIRRKGLTLIEFVVASTLTILAMTAIMGLLRLMNEQRKASLTLGDDGWHVNVVDLLEQDLIGCRQIAFDNGELRMVGQMLDSTFSRHQPTETILRLVQPAQDRSGWLTRSLRKLGSIESESISLLCGNVLSWHVERIDDLGQPQPISTDLSPSPRRIQVSLLLRSDRTQERWVHWLIVAH